MGGLDIGEQVVLVLLGSLGRCRTADSRSDMADMADERMGIGSVARLPFSCSILGGGLLFGGD